MKPWFAATLVLFAIPALAADPVTVSKPWARASVGPNAAVYLTLSVGNGEADRLLGAQSPAARKAEMHTHAMENGIMSMRSVDSIDIVTGHDTVLAPSSLHLMLLDIREPLREGSRFPLSLTFARSGTVAVEVPVLGPGASGPP